MNNGDGTFKDMTETAIGIDTKKGMNVDWGDFDNDGLLDIYVTNITDDYMREGNFLWKNNGNLTFTDVSRETGTYDTGWGWGAKFFDYDNDGWLDLYVTNGWVSAGKRELRARHLRDDHQARTSTLADARNWPPMGNKSLSGYQKKRLFHNERGQAFTDQAPKYGVDSIARRPRHRRRGFRQRRPARHVRRQRERRAVPLPQHAAGRSGHWAEFVLDRRRSRTGGAVGAQVRVTAGGRTHAAVRRRRQRLRRPGESRACTSASATATTIDTVEVRWPSGLRQTLTNVPVDRLTRITEGSQNS